MKISRLPLLFLLVFLFSISLSACAGSTAANSWPGVTVDGDTAYVAYNQFVYAVNATNGTEKWRFPVKADSKITFFASPVLTNNGQLLAGSYDNLLYSLNPQNGQENQNGWPFKAKNRFIASPLVTDQGIFAPSEDSNLYALSPAGKLLWSFQTQNALWATPVADSKAIYQPSMDHHIYALDIQTGNLLWKSEDLGGALVSSPTLSPDGVLYIGTFASTMLALNTKDGKILWSTPTSGWVWSGPALDNGNLYFGDLNGTFYELNATDGKEIWKVQPSTTPPLAISDKPLIEGDSIFLTTESGTLFALNKADGTQRWNKQIGGKLYTSPAASGNAILVAPVGINPLLIALDSNGNELWNYIPAK
jgi:outer membrane protein assembly factor BamB